MLTCELNSAVQSIASIMWGHTKWKRDRQQRCKFCKKYCQEVLSGLKWREGEGRKSHLSQISYQPGEEGTDLWD